MPSLVQSTHQAHKQQFSARLQKAVRLLHMPNAEFAAMVQSTLADNPFLDSEELANPPLAAGPEPALPAPPELPDPAQAPDAGEGSAWTALPSERRARSAGGVELDALAFVAAPTSLHEHLHAQLRLRRLPDRAFLLASILCESLDDDGYLREPLDDIALFAEVAPRPAPAEIESALAQVQSLDPPGVGARCAAECLRLQLGALTCPDQRAWCERVLRAWEDTPQLRDPAQLAHRLGCATGEVHRALKLLRGLDPHPGWRHGADDTRYVVPDVIARRTRQGWTAQLNEAVVPRVRVHEAYARLHRQQQAGDAAALDGQLQEARWTVRNIEKRFSTILAVAQAIVRHQQQFFEHGPLAMRPLVLRQIAEELGMHESTVSRVTSQKYIATPRGTFELGSFFSRGLQAGSGGAACAPTAVRGLVQEIIAAERGMPLSDVTIAQRLARQGIKIARRTVTKYRQQLGLRPAEQRRADL